MFWRTGDHVGLRAGVGDGLNALGLEVAVAKPTVILTARVDDAFDGLVDVLMVLSVVAIINGTNNW